MSVELRPLARSDLPAMLAIERAAFSTPWRSSTFEALFDRADTDLLAAVHQGTLVGYAVCWTILDQAELGNVAVAPECRGRGVGRRLVQAALARVRERGAAECFLEVRASNEAARILYERSGFEPIGRRRRYYSRPTEDAVVMRARL
ncbi:MAG TPA: ribosomal protein S18-alanine N-acetyltransferase [Longimicrobiaceae bacterium]|nr:ribosomal protein S18-alanine N-acetyltransferase [Longimicrobiaceae bacterium]